MSDPTGDALDSYYYESAKISNLNISATDIAPSHLNFGNVSIDRVGNVVIKDEATLDEASKEFWKVVRAQMQMPDPAGNQIRTTQWSDEDAVPMTGQSPVGTASTNIDDAVGWWFQDKTGAIHLGLDLQQGLDQSAGVYEINYLYGKPLPPGNVDGITIAASEVKALLYGVPKFEFAQTKARLAAWLAKVENTAIILTSQVTKARTEHVDEMALDKAAREGYAVRCKTYGPRTLQKYASDEIMQMQLDDARVIVSAYLAALSVEQAPQPVARATRPVGYISGFYRDVIDGKTAHVPLAAEMSFVNLNWPNQIALYAEASPAEQTRAAEDSVE